MSRRRRAVKREIRPDARHHSRLVGRLVNTIMKCGKRNIAQSLVYDAFDQISEKQEGATPLEVLQRAVENAKPRLEVKSRRVGGATYQVPLEVSGERSEALALRWIVGFAKARNIALSPKVISASASRLKFRPWARRSLQKIVRSKPI